MCPLATGGVQNTETELDKDLVWSKYPERKGRIPELVKRIRPIMRFDGVMYFVDPLDPVNQSYHWARRKIEVVAHYGHVRDIVTYHHFGHVSLFKPSVAEVIAQIPEDVFDYVNAFEIIWKPETVEDLNNQLYIINKGYHEVRTKLYAGAVPFTKSEKLLRFIDDLVKRFT